jgi:hypothetical protein
MRGLVHSPLNEVSLQPGLLGKASRDIERYAREIEPSCHRAASHETSVSRPIEHCKWWMRFPETSPSSVASMAWRASSPARNRRACSRRLCRAWMVARSSQFRRLTSIGSTMEGFFVHARRPYMYRVSGQGARSLGWIHAPKTLILLGPRSSASEPGASPFVPASRLQTQI